MDNRVIIPAALILDLDDMMWHDGRDLRHKGQASRSEFPRMHVPEDYTAVNELGRALNMKIICPICIGDWDKENCLRGVVGPTHNPGGWNRKAEIDYAMTEKYFEAAESSDYIEYAYHGLLHGLYDANGARLNEWEYFKREEGKPAELLSDDELNLHLDLFDKIYGSWGFKKKIRTFCPPCGIPLADKTDWTPIDRFSSILYDRGVRYIIARWHRLTEKSRLCSGVLYMEKNARFGISSAAADVDPRYIPDFVDPGDELYGDVMGMHWANFLHYYPQNNRERLGYWITYFNRQAEVFGMMISRDIAFTGRQCIYRKNSKIAVSENECTVDITDALAGGFEDLGRDIYISFRNDSLPKVCDGGTMELYESRREFKTYKVTANGNIIRFCL
nr:hypothetical protein [Clostridia bacterium]